MIPLCIRVEVPWLLCLFPAAERRWAAGVEVASLRSARGLRPHDDEPVPDRSRGRVDPYSLADLAPRADPSRSARKGTPTIVSIVTAYQRPFIAAASLRLHQQIR